MLTRSPGSGRRAARTLRRAGLALLLAVLAGCAASRRAPPPSTEMEDYGFRNAVRTLCADAFDGRRPGTDGEEKTVGWLVARLKALGLKPGNGESYLQAVPLTELTPDRSVTLRVGAAGGVRELAYDRDVVLWSGLPVADAALEGSPLVFVGYGIVAPEYGWDDYAGVDMRGKTAIVLMSDPGVATRDPRLFRGDSLTYYGLWQYKIAEAVRHGAAGVLLVHDVASTGFDWEVVRNAWEGPRDLSRGPDRDRERAPVEGWLRAEAARGVFSQAGLDFDRLSASAARRGFHATPLGSSASVRLHNALREFSSSNVIAWLPGARRQHEYVVYGTHWDGLGRAEPSLGGMIRPGAVDDAAGVAGWLQLAQSISRTRPPPDRSIVFVAFTAAESGALGSRYYVAHPPFPLRDTAAALMLERPRIGGPTRDVAIYGYGNSELDETVRAVALIQGRDTRGEPDPEHGWFLRGDDFSFARSGVPVVYATGGLDDSARGPAWGRERLDQYYARVWRRPADAYSEDWDVRGTLEDLRLYAEVGLELARSRRFPHWNPQSDYRSSRGPWSRGQD